MEKIYIISLIASLIIIFIMHAIIDNYKIKLAAEQERSEKLNEALEAEYRRLEIITNAIKKNKGGL